MKLDYQKIYNFSYKKAQLLKQTGEGVAVQKVSQPNIFL